MNAQAVATVIGSLITAAATLTGVLIATRRQTSRIDRDNRAALDAQIEAIRQHVGGGDLR